MKKLYAPWRSNYTNQVTEQKSTPTNPDECIFCIQSKGNDDHYHHILARFEHAFILLNLYPYNAGHILIIPHEHYPTLSEYPQAARAELIELANVSSFLLKKVLGAHAINFGINEGKIAGAGIPAHLHMHVLPRWLGDTNFLPLLADTKQISMDLKQIYSQMLPHFSKINKKNYSYEETVS